MFEKIVTQRLALRELEMSDAQRIFQYRSQPEVARFQSWGSQTVEEIESHIRSLSEIQPGTAGAWYQVGITLPGSSELIGDCGFHVPSSEPRQAEIGIALSPEFQGQGYASEALRMLLDYLFAKLGKHRVYGSVDPRNVRSMRLMQRVGMRLEAHFVKSLWFKGEWVDDVIFAMLASDWKATEQMTRKKPD